MGGIHLQKAFLVLAAAACPWMAPAWADPGGEPAAAILALERGAMDGWLKGDPGPQLAIMDPQITYFHAVVENRLDGLPAVKELYERFRGTPLFDSYEILAPDVQVSGEVAVLTYRLAQHNGTVTTFWNATQVYRMRKEGWRVIHTHWSAAKERQP
jgi:hypothetical protein